MLLCSGVVAAILLLLMLLLHASLAAYLSHVDAAAIYQLAISVGAALVGLIGVVFTLTLFVIQQISSTSIPGLLREYASDRGTQVIYACLSFLALLALGSSLIIPAKHPFAPVVSITVAVVGALGLLWALFQRVVKLSDPSSVIQRLRKRGLEELRSLESLRIAVLETSPALARERVRLNQDASTIPSALALLRHHNPSLTARTERHLRQLYALVRRLASENQTDLFREAIGATSDVLNEYVDRHGANITMPNTATFMFGMDVSQDRILSNALDFYSSVAKASIPSADVEMSKATLGGLSAIAATSVNRAPLNPAHGENATTGLILGTMTDVIQQFVAKGHIEGVFSSFALVSPVISRLEQAGFYQTALFNVTKLSDLTQLCLVAKQPILATEGVSQMLGMLSFSLQNSLQAGGIAGAVVKELYAVCRMQLEVEPNASGRVGFDIGRSHPISRIFSAAPDTLVGLHYTVVQEAIAALKSKQKDRWEHLSHFLSEFHEHLPQQMAELGGGCANKHHMLLFYLETAAFGIAQRMLSFWHQLGDVTEDDGRPEEARTGEDGMRRYRNAEYRTSISKKLKSFIIFFYSHSTTFHAKGIFDDKVMGCYESVVSISSDATLIGATEVATATAEMLVHSAAAALDKYGYVAVRPACRIVGRLLETALIAKVKENDVVYTVAETTIKKIFVRCLELTIIEQEKHPDSHLDDPMRLIDDGLREYVHGGRNMMFDEKSRTFARTVTIQTAHEYLLNLEAMFAAWVQELILPPPPA